MQSSLSSYLQQLTWFLSHKSASTFEKETWNLSPFAANLVSAYKHILVAYPVDLSETIHVPLLPFVTSDYSHDPRFKPVQDLANSVHLLAPHLVDFLIHGSIATLDVCFGWSDIDTLVILRDDSLLSVETLLDIREQILSLSKLLYDFDTLQHHEFIFCTERLMLLDTIYSLPMQVLTFSKSFYSSCSLALSSKRDYTIARLRLKSLLTLYNTSHITGVFDHHRKHGVALTARLDNLHTMYQLKYFISTVLTLPSYALDALGSPCYKRDSFSKVDQLFPTGSNFIHLLEDIRASWPQFEPFPYYSNKIPDWLIQNLGNDFLYNASELATEVSSLI